MSTTGPTPAQPAGDDGPPTADPAAAAMQRFQRHGDRTELERALLLCAPELHRAAQRLAGAMQAEDLLQDTFLAAIRGADTFAGGRLIPWLVGILQNSYRSSHRRRWAKLHLSPSQTPDAHGGPAEPSATEPPPTLAIEQQEWQRRILATADGLAEPYRTVVIEHLCAGKALVQLATQLGRSPSTVRSQYWRGLQELRRRLPTPLLGGLLAVLAVREGKAMAGIAGVASTSIPTAARSPLLWLGVAAAVLLGSWLLLPEAGAPDLSPQQDAFAAAAAAYPTAPTPSDSPADAAVDRVADSAATRRVRLRLNLATGEPASDLPVWCDTNFVAGEPVIRVHQQWRLGRTDANGEVAFEVPRHTTAAFRLHELELLHTLAPGEQNVDWALTVVAGNQLEFECVDANGNPVSDATIFACGTQGTRSPGLPVARSDAFGRGQTRTALASTNLWATAPGHRLTQKSTVHRSNDPRQIVRGRFELPPAEQWVRGRVLNQHGVAIAGATVAVWTAQKESLPPLHLLSDAAGGFACQHLPHGDWFAAAAAPGYAMAMRRCTADDGSCELVLHPGVDVTGRVAGIAGMHHERLRIVTNDGDRSNPLAGHATTVAADGSFALKNMHSGEFQGRLFDKLAQVDDFKFTVTDGPPPPLELRLSPATMWQIQVVDTDGRPMQDCLLRSWGSLALIGHKNPEQAVTDSNGYARLRRAATPRNLHVHLRRNGAHETFPIHETQHSATGEVLRITIAPNRARASLHGQIPEALRGGLGTGSLLLKHAGIDQNVAYDPDGIFHVEDLPPGELWILAWYEPNLTYFELAAFDLAPGENKPLAPIEMAPLGTLRLRIVDGTDGMPMHLHVLDGQRNQVSIGALYPGADRTLRVPPGRYQVNFAGPDGARRSKTFDVASNETTAADLAANAGQPCRLIVPRNPSSAGYHDLLVQVTDATATGSIEAHLMTSKFDDALRAWKLDLCLQPGTYRVLAQGADDTQYEGTIVVSARPGLQTIPIPRQ